MLFGCFDFRLFSWIYCFTRNWHIIFVAFLLDLDNAANLENSIHGPEERMQQNDEFARYAYDEMLDEAADNEDEFSSRQINPPVPLFG